MSWTTRLIAGSLLAVVVIVGSACSASTDKASKTTTTVGADTAKKAKDVPVDEKKETSKKAPTAVSGSFCEMAKGYEDVMKKAMFGGMSLDEEPDEAEMFKSFKSGMNVAFGYLKDMAKVAPSEVKSDMKLMMDASDDYMDAVNSATSMDDETMQAADKLMDSPELDAASDRMEKYWEDRCGVEPLGSSFPDGS